MQSNESSPIIKKVALRINPLVEKTLFISSTEVKIVYLKAKRRRKDSNLSDNIKFIKKSTRGFNFFSEVFREASSQRMFLEKLYKFHETQNTLNKFDSLGNTKFKNNFFHNIFIQAVRHDYSLKNSLLQLKKQHINVLQRHLRAFDLYLSYTKLKNKKIDLIAFANTLLLLEKEGFQEFIGLIESQIISFEKLLTFNKKEIIKYLNIFSPNIEIEEIKNLSIPGCKIKHINSTSELKRVGKEMHHCAGGLIQLLVDRKAFF